MTGDIGAVIFDIDDTLIDRTEAQRKIMRLIVEGNGDVFGGYDEQKLFSAFMESDRLTLHTMYRQSSPGLPAMRFRTERCRLFLGMLGLDEGLAPRLAEQYSAFYDAVAAPMEGALEVLEALWGKLPLGVVSNGFPDVQMSKLKALGVDRAFGCIVVSEEVMVRKPDPRIFRMAADRLLVEPRICLFVGNSFEDDVVGAKKAGMKACWFNPLCLPVPVGETRPDFDIMELVELPDVLGIGRNEGGKDAV